MKKTTFAAMLIVCSVAHAQIAGTKPGLWKTKVVRQVVDGRDMIEQIQAAQAQMAKMTPEQRKQLESVMKGMSGRDTDGSMRVCISQAMAAKNALLSEPNSHCPAVSLSKDGNKTKYSFNCTKDGRTTVGSGESIVNGDVISNHFEATTSGTHGNHTVLMDSEMTYLGSDCQGVASIDQLVKPADASGK